MKLIIAIVLGFLMALGVTAIDAAVITTVWNWFLVPSIIPVKMTWLAAMGLSCVFNLLCPHQSFKFDPNDSRWGDLLMAIARPIFILIFAAVVKFLFM